MELQAAYSCFITAFKHKPSYIMRTIPDISDQLNQLDEVITSEFIPAITGGIRCSNIERKLLSLPSKLGGRGGGPGIPIFAEISNQEYEYSLILSKDLSTRIMKQEIQLSSETNVQNTKQKIKSQKQQKHQAKLENIRSCLTEEQIRLNNLNQEHGSSTWLTTLRYQKKDTISQNSSSGISFEFVMDGHSQDFQLIVSTVKNSTSCMLGLARK